MIKFIWHLIFQRMHKKICAIRKMSTITCMYRLFHAYRQNGIKEVVINTLVAVVKIILGQTQYLHLLAPQNSTKMKLTLVCFYFKNSFKSKLYHYKKTSTLNV